MSAIALVSALAAGCATTTTVAVLPAGHQELLADDDDFHQLVAQLRTDLTVHATRETARAAVMKPRDQQIVRVDPNARARRESDFAARARALFAPLSGRPMVMPVVGIYASNLGDTWHAPRDGGSRVHKGIDIFAPKGTPVVAVTDGFITFIGDQPKGGHCIWLASDDGTAYYYAHLDRWAPGLYEGMEVQRGDVIGFVGNTGNARRTPPHLHFGINRNDEMVNPYPHLIRAVPVTQPRYHVAGGGITAGSR